jgi:hypothetical protein
MKYWGFFVLKLLVTAIVGFVLWEAIHVIWPSSRLSYYGVPAPRFGHDLVYTLVLLLYNLVLQGLIWLSIWDQRYRCRICLRRLRMPVEQGSWSHMLLFGPPHTEYICTYGHGALDVPEIPVSGRPVWKRNEDMWKELFKPRERSR